MNQAQNNLYSQKYIQSIIKKHMIDIGICIMLVLVATSISCYAISNGIFNVEPPDKQNEEFNTKYLDKSMAIIYGQNKTKTMIKYLDELKRVANNYWAPGNKNIIDISNSLTRIFYTYQIPVFSYYQQKNETPNTGLSLNFNISVQKLANSNVAEIKLIITDLIDDANQYQNYFKSIELKKWVVQCQNKDIVINSFTPNLEIPKEIREEIEKSITSTDLKNTIDTYLKLQIEKTDNAITAQKIKNESLDKELNKLFSNEIYGSFKFLYDITKRVFLFFVLSSILFFALRRISNQTVFIHSVHQKNIKFLMANDMTNNIHEYIQIHETLSKPVYSHASLNVENNQDIDIAKSLKDFISWVKENLTKT